MKKQLAAATAVVLAFGITLCACGKKNTADSASAAVGASAEADAYTEELPRANELIHESPIPGDTGTLKLTEQSFDRFAFKLMLPPDVTVEESPDSVDTSDEDTGNWVRVTDSNEKWTISFSPLADGEYVRSRALADHGAGLSRQYRDADSCDTTIAGFPAFVSAANINDTGRSINDAERIPELDIVIDYGSEYVGRWAGMRITLRTADRSAGANIYEYLYLRHVRAVLNGFEVIRGTESVSVAAGGVGADIPARWSPRADDQSGAVTADIIDEAGRGSLLITSVKTSDHEEYAKMRADAAGAEVFTKTYGDRSFCGFIKAISSPTVDVSDEKKTAKNYIAELYSDMGGGRAVRVVMTLRGAEEESLGSFLNGDIVSEVMSTVTADPEGYSDSGKFPDSGDFSCGADGVITGYSGSGGAVVIPAEISGVTVTGIGDSAFKDCDITSLTIPAGVTEIGSKAFSGSAVSSVNASNGLMLIGNGAFSGCKYLSDLVLPETVSYIGYEAFSKAGADGFICRGEPKFESKAMSRSRFDTIEIRGGDLTSPKIMTGSYAKSIYLGDGVAAVGQECVSECKNLTKLELPYGLKALGKYCFSADPKLRTVTLPEGIELIPEGCFWNTSLDTIVIPKSVTGIEHYAVTKAAYLVLSNPKTKLGIEALNIERIYLNGVYRSEDVPRNLDEQYIAMQIFLPMDATIKESEKMDAYLNGIGFGEIAWFGTPAEFLPEDSSAFKVNEDCEITGCSDDHEYLYLPHCAFNSDKNKEIYGLKKNVFSGSEYKEIYINSNIEVIPADAFSGSDNVTDLWFTGAISYQLGLEGFESGCLSGLPGDLTVHLPASIAEEERTDIQNALVAKGLSSNVTFDYYDL